MRRLFALCLLLPLASCDSVAPPDGFEGDWDWVYTSYGHVSGPTPETLGYDLVLRVSDGDFTLFRDGERIQDGRYHLSRDGTLETEALRFRPMLDDPAFNEYEGDRLLIDVSHDALYLSAPCFDCVGFSFRRAAP